MGRMEGKLFGSKRESNGCKFNFGNMLQGRQSVWILLLMWSLEDKSIGCTMKLC